MKLKAYTIFDDKALQYHPPFYAATDGAATRNFQEVANDSSTSIGRHPSDFRLYCCGEYDDNNGQFTPFSPLVHIVDAVALLKIQTALPFAKEA